MNPPPHESLEPTARVIRLELHLTEDSLSGRASDPNGATREFVGWVGLVAAIDALVQGDRPPVGSGEAQILD